MLVKDLIVLRVEKEIHKEDNKIVKNMKFENYYSTFNSDQK